MRRAGRIALALLLPLTLACTCLPGALRGALAPPPPPPVPRSSPSPPPLATDPPLAPTVAGMLAYASEDGRFNCLFPGAPTHSTETAPSALGPLTFHLYSYESPTGAAYLTSWNDYPANIPFDVEAGLTGGRDGMLQNMGGTLLEEREIRLDGVHPGRQLRFTIRQPIPATAHAKLFIVGHRLYQMMALIPTGSSEAIVPTFLDSLHVTVAP